MQTQTLPLEFIFTYNISWTS